MTSATRSPEKATIEEFAATLEAVRARTEALKADVKEILGQWREYTDEFPAPSGFENGALEAILQSRRPPYVSKTLRTDSSR